MKNENRFFILLILCFLLCGGVLYLCHGMLKTSAQKQTIISSSSEGEIMRDIEDIKTTLARLNAEVESLKNGNLVSAVPMPSLATMQPATAQFEHKFNDNGVILAAVMDTKLPANSNVAYAAAFPIAWNTLIEKVTKVKPKFASNIALANKLNEQKTGAQDIDSSAYFTDAGFKKDGIERRVLDGLKKKFNTTPINDISLKDPTDILAYAYMYKDLRFKDKFGVEEYFEFNSGDGKYTNVESFGTEGSAGTDRYEMLQAVTINYYTPQSFIVTLKSKDKEDEIIFALLPKENTLSATVNKAMALRTKQDKMADIDQLLIPNLNFDITQEFEELSNIAIVNFPPYAITKALETIKFNLDAEGVKVIAEAVMGVMGAAPGSFKPQPKPKIMYFNKPFLVMLKEKTAKNPYFALWVDNADIMKKADIKEPEHIEESKIYPERYEVEPFDKISSIEHYKLGLVQYHAGNYEKAKEEWKAALRLDPNNSSAAMGLQRIESRRNL